MRLINVDSLKLETFFGGQLPPYAVLSHRWGDDGEEVSFDDMRRELTEKTGMQKLIRCCQIAKQEKIQYVWIDTCCINKESSKELDEAIDSMFKWYRNASVCLTYMGDVPHNDDVWDPASRFFSTAWFRRGWTLQALLVTGKLRFYDQDWSFTGTKADLSSEIEHITDIPRKSLLNWVDFYQASVAQRISWASKRETKREDMAYCLLSIFDATMPMIYGEGNKAFERLQLNIMEQIIDDSILACGDSPAGIESPSCSGENTASGSILASSPADFVGCGRIVPLSGLIPRNTFVISGGYLRTFLALQRCRHAPAYGLLNCRSECHEVSVIAIPLCSVMNASAINEHLRPQGHRPAIIRFVPTGPNFEREEVQIRMNRQSQPSWAEKSIFGSIPMATAD